jgi:hypothetical protein
MPLRQEEVLLDWIEEQQVSASIICYDNAPVLRRYVSSGLLECIPEFKICPIGANQRKPHCREFSLDSCFSPRCPDRLWRHLVSVTPNIIFDGASKGLQIHSRLSLYNLASWAVSEWAGKPAFRKLDTTGAIRRRTFR